MSTARAAGFTLLELLAALVVLGFILLGLGQGLQFGRLAWGTQARLIAARSEQDAADRALRRLIEQMEPGNDLQHASITGDAQHLAFTATLPAGASGGLPLRADVALSVAEKRGVLLRWAPHLHAQRLGATPPPQESVLVPGATRLEIGYWRRAGGGAWSASWNAPDPPDLVRLHLGFPPGDARRWPDIIAAPMRERAEE